MRVHVWLSLALLALLAFSCVVTAQESDSDVAISPPTAERAAPVESPRLLRLRELFERGGAAMRAMRSGSAGPAELSELQAVQAGLTAEFNRYPADLQKLVRPSYIKVNTALGKIITQLQAKLAVGNVQAAGVELTAEDDVTAELEELLSAAAAADSAESDADSAVAAESDFDALQRGGRGWDRGRPGRPGRGPYGPGRGPYGPGRGPYGPGRGGRGGWWGRGRGGWGWGRGWGPYYSPYYYPQPYPYQPYDDDTTIIIDV